MNSTKWERAESITVRVKTPDGEMFVTLIESPDHKLMELKVYIGKGGSNVFAWGEALAASISTSLQADVDVYTILESLVGIKSDKLVYSSGIPITSSADGLANAILMYLKDRDTRLGIDKPYFKRDEKDWE